MSSPGASAFGKANAGASSVNFANNAPQYKYWAFISYSHKDRAIGDWLHRALETYTIPKALVRAQPAGADPMPARLYPIFRDREELAAAPDLGNRIEDALRQSRYLIVVCSPDAAASPWVNKEIAFFKSIGREDSIFALIARGEPYASERPGSVADECFPQALRYRVGADGRITDQRAEPLGADLREGKDGRQNALLKLIAGMLQTGFDTLRHRALERRNAFLRRVVAASVALVLVFAAIALYALIEQQRAEERGRVASSRQLAVESRSLLDTSPDLPLLLSLEATYARETVEARRSLFEALTAARRPVALFHSPSGQPASGLVASKDGTTIATAGTDGRLVFFDITTEPPATRVQDAHVGAVRGLALNPARNLLASAGDDGQVILWDFPSGHRRTDRVIPKQSSPVTAVALGPRDLVAFGTGPQDGLTVLIQVWDPAVGQPVFTGKPTSDGSVTAIRFSPDGNSLASASVGGDTILWNLTTGDQIHGEFVKDTGSLAFSPDGQWLASGSWELSLRRTSDFQPLTFTLPDAPTHVNSVEFSPKGTALASGAESGNVIVWDAMARRPVEGPFQLNTGPIDNIGFTPDGSRLFATGAGGTIAKISLGVTPLRRDLQAKSSSFAFQPGRDRSLVSAGTDAITFWDSSILRPVKTIPVPRPNNIGVFAFSADGKILAWGARDGSLTVVDVERGNALAPPVRIGGGRIDALSFARDGSMLAIVPVGREVYLFDVKQNQVHGKPLIADKEYARAAVFSHDGHRVLTAGDGGEVIEWDAASGQQVGLVEKAAEGVDALAFSPDGKLLAFGDYKGRVTLWDVDRRRVSGVPLAAHTNIVRTVAFSNDGLMLASGGDDGQAILWDVNSRQILATFRHGAAVLSGDGSARTPLAVNRLAFSPDGTTLAADGPQDRILLWDTDLASWKREACSRASRNLTPEEWRRYLGDDTAYRATCPAGAPRADDRPSRLWRLGRL